MDRRSILVGLLTLLLGSGSGEPADARSKRSRRRTGSRRRRSKGSSGSSYVGSYSNCAEVRAAGAAPIRRGEPGYSRKLDRDGDGVACE
uniref:excalibur calcium-binding domain-containing protein n=1 Tax=Asticcacaulis sp. DW145 TaxID=3095608 RepID=UPI00403F0B86